MTRYTKRRERLKAEGRCTVCGSIHTLGGGTRCKVCAQKQSENIKKMRERKKERGECMFCKNQAVPGKVLCSVCAEKNRQRYLQSKSAKAET